MCICVCHVYQSACSFCSCIFKSSLNVLSSLHAFISCSASGRIVNAYANNFDALKDNGFIYVEIENTGEVTSEFSVSH